MKIAAYTSILDTVFGVVGAPAHEHTVARGDAMFDADVETRLTSILPGVSDAAWTKFACVMATAGLSDVSPSNALGTFELMPRRLADLGLCNNLDRVKSPKSGRTIWVADFVAPMTSDKFLRSPQAQYRVFCASMKAYANKIASGEIEKPEGMSLSGALAILHKAGPKGLISEDRFPATQAIYEKTASVF